MMGKRGSLPRKAAPQTKTVDKISLIFPSRGRVQLLRRLLESIEKTTRRGDGVEVLVAVDRDDAETMMVVDCFSGVGVAVRGYWVDRSVNFSRDYYNFLYGKSVGRWVMAINDDAVFETDGWDEVVRESLAGRDVVYGVIEDCLGDAKLPTMGEYSCWPLLGRGGVDVLGYFFPERIPTWGADIWAAKLYRRAGAVVPVPVVIRHVCHHNGLRERDEINVRVGNNAGVYSAEPTGDEVGKIMRAIDG